MSNVQAGRNSIPEYVIWKQIKQRCNNPNHPSYGYYGGRGVVLCSDWDASFEKFFEAVGPRPSSEHTLDRIDNTKGYVPGNCRWVTRAEQARNRRDNRLITYHGETKTIAEWAAEAPPEMYQAVRSRLYLGWPLEEAMTLPVRSKRRTNAKHARNLAARSSDVPLAESEPRGSDAGDREGPD